VGWIEISFGTALAGLSRASDPLASRLHRPHPRACDRLNHSDFTARLEDPTWLPEGPTGLPHWRRLQSH
jgi:hypothetical protein